MKAKFVSQMLLGVGAGLWTIATFGDGCYVHSSDWQGGYWGGYDGSYWHTVENGFVAQSGGYYWCCKYTPDGEGVIISGVINGVNDDGEYTYYSGVYSDQWDGNPKSASKNVSGNLSIPSYVYGKPVVEIGKYVLSYYDNVTGITIPSSVTNIGERAFCGCSGLKSVTIPSAVRRIGELAFGGCSSLTSISIPNSVEVVENGAFQNCTLLTSVSCPANVELGEDVFVGCEGLRKNGMIIAGGCLWDASKCAGNVVVPDGVKRVCRYAFCREGSIDYNDDWLDVKIGVDVESVTLPNSIVLIETGAFYACRKLKSINFPPGLTKIGDRAFMACKALTQLQFPYSLEEIGEAAFDHCTGVTHVEVPTSVKLVGMAAFGDCQLDRLILGQAPNLWSLGWALENRYCEYGGEVEVHFGSVSQWQNVYWYLGPTGSGSSPVKEVVVTSGEKIKDGFFADCESIEKISLPAEVKSVGKGSFKGCKELQAVVVPSENVAYVVVNGVLYEKDKSVLVWCPVAKTSLTMFDGVTSIDDYAFYGCESLESLTISEGVTNIGNYAFYNCKGLTTLVIPESVNSIGSYAFSWCSGLTSLVVPRNVRSIGSSAFYRCSGLMSLELLAQIEKIEDDTFKFCSGLTSFEIPQSVTSIGYRAFERCEHLTSLTIPQLVTNISGSAFYMCGVSKVKTALGDSERIKGLLSKSGMNVSRVTFIEPSQPHVVVFDVGVRGTRIGGGALSQTVNHGEAAEAPLVQSDYGWEFCGWNCDFSIVTNDLNVVAQWNRLTLSAKIGNETWTFHAEGDGVVIGNAGKVAVAGNTNGSLMIPEQLDGKTVVGIDECAFAGLDGLRSVVIPSSVVSIGNGAFAGCVGLDTIKVATGEADRVRRLVADSGLDVSWVEFREKGASSGSGGVTDVVCLTITNVVVNYIVNSVQPSFVLPPTYDTGFVNIIAEVKGGCVAVPATWTVNYPKFTEKFGTDFTKALAMQTGKKDGAGNPMFVWQDYVAGTDPTDETDVFTASITIVDGKVKVSYSPELDDARRALRKYTTWGKEKLTDKDWSVVGEGEEGNFNFFKVTVEMR